MTEEISKTKKRHTHLRVLEFFSGIGGMHYGLELFCLLNNDDKNVYSMEIVDYFDINTHANTTYEYNFPKPKTTKQQEPKNKSIEHSITLQNLQKQNNRSNCWLLSPPCQPFTKGGNGLDDTDDRSKGLLHLIRVLRELGETELGLNKDDLGKEDTKEWVNLLPNWLFLENVVGFETSNCRNKLVAALQECGYKIKEFIISPLQMGIPNDRKRYYLAASRNGNSSRGNLKRHDVESVPLYTSWPIAPSRRRDDNDVKEDSVNEQVEALGTIMTTPTVFLPAPLSTYLDPNVDISTHLVPEKDILKRHQFRFDLVSPSDRRTSTFTKAYGSRHLIGSGSLLRTSGMDVEVDFTDMNTVLTTRPRFCSSTELARLHAFPIDEVAVGNLPLESFYGCQLMDENERKIWVAEKRRVLKEAYQKGQFKFAFPESDVNGKDLKNVVGRMQQYRLLGNSLNVYVVACLLAAGVFS